MPLTKNHDGVTPAAIFPALPIVPTAVFVQEGTILGGPPGFLMRGDESDNFQFNYSVNPQVALVVWRLMCPVGVSG